MINFKVLDKQNNIVDITNEHIEIKYAIDNLYSKFQTEKNVLHLFFAAGYDFSFESNYDLTSYDKVFLDFSGADYIFRYFDMDKLLSKIEAKQLYIISKNPIELNNGLYIDPLLFRIAELDFTYSFDGDKNDYFYFGGHARYHRLKFLSLLKELGLLNKLSWSQRAVSDSDHFRDIIPYEFKDSYKRLSIHTDLPKMLDIQIMDNTEYHGTKNENWITDNAGVKPNLEFQLTHWAEIISETIYYFGINPTKSDDSFLYFSEKTFKPLSLGYPFIGLLLPNSFKKIKEFGFKLFDEIFDYTFDSIVNDDDRMKAIVNQIQSVDIRKKIIDNKESILEKHIFNRNRFKEFKKETIAKYEKSLLH
jgi:hypothetical protein